MGRADVILGAKMHAASTHAASTRAAAAPTVTGRRRFTALALLALPWLLPAALRPTEAAAQQMSASERGAAVARVRQVAECLERQRAAMARITRLIEESEQQRDAARQPRVRRDAERALEALVARAADVQRAARGCLGEALPSPGTEVVVREAPLDASERAIAQAGGTVRTVEEDARLSPQLQVIRAEQVDGQGRLEEAVVRRGVRTVTDRLGRCYDAYLRRGSIAARQLELVFTLRGAGRPRAVAVERSGFGDASFERCVRAAGQAMRFSQAPRGGAAIYSYTLRFGR